MSELMEPGKVNDYGVQQQESEIVSEKHAWQMQRQEYAARAAAQARPMTAQGRPKGFLCGGQGNGSGWGGGHYR